MKPESKESSAYRESQGLEDRAAFPDPEAGPERPESAESDSLDPVVHRVRAGLLELAEALELLELAGSQALQAALDLPASPVLRALASPGCLVPVVSAARRGLLVRPVLLVDARSAPLPSRQLVLPGARASLSPPSTSGGSTGQRR